jgi:hypothetical protein
LLRQLLNTGGFHARKMPRNAPRRKLAFALRNGGKNLARPCLTAIDDLLGLGLLLLDPPQKICRPKRLRRPQLDPLHTADRHHADY